MSKRKDRRNARQAFESVVAIAGAAARDEEDDAPFAHDHAPVSDQILAVSPDLRRVLTPQSNGVRRELTRMKRFRFQLLHQWICDNVPAPCRVADVGGGKGLLAYLLNQSGYHATTIDPVPQALPAKYKDLAAGRQVRIAETESVPRRALEKVSSCCPAASLTSRCALHPAPTGCNASRITPKVKASPSNRCA
jgi:hypothetical protein